MTENRVHFIGFHVTKSVRNELRRVTTKRGISISRFLYEMVLEKLELPDLSEHSTEELISRLQSPRRNDGSEAV